MKVNQNGAVASPNPDRRLRLKYHLYYIVFSLLILIYANLSLGSKLFSNNAHDQFYKYGWVVLGVTWVAIVAYVIDFAKSFSNYKKL